jgi:hypothetical protein
VDRSRSTSRTARASAWPGRCGRSGHHTGLDFPAAVGTPVKAVDRRNGVGVGTPARTATTWRSATVAASSSLYAHMSKHPRRAQSGRGAGAADRQGWRDGQRHWPSPPPGGAEPTGKSVDPMPYLTSIRAWRRRSARASRRRRTSRRAQLGLLRLGPGPVRPLEKLWTGESGWRWNAENRSSGAYGIPQALPGSKMASAGSRLEDERCDADPLGHGLHQAPSRLRLSVGAYAKWLARSPLVRRGRLPPAGSVPRGERHGKP